VEGERKDNIGANRRTAEHVGGGAAIGAIIGAYNLEGRRARLSVER
jgi:hypothetical protein